MTEQAPMMEVFETMKIVLGRRHRAMAAIAAYVEASELAGADLSGEEAETIICDLLADLFHFIRVIETTCGTGPIGVDDLVGRAINHFEIEHDERGS